MVLTGPSSMQPSTDAGTESSDHDSDLYIHPSPDVLNPQTSTTPSASLSIDDLPDPNNAAAQLHQLISRVIHTRETEEKILGERYQASLSHLAELDKAFSSAKEKAKLANNRVFAVRREITLLEDRECTAADVQQASEYLNFVEEEKSWMTAYVNIASSLPDKAFLDRIQVEHCIKHTAFPPLESILAVACAAQEEAYTEKVAAEHRIKTCHLQCHIHGIALEKTKKVRQLAEQGLALLAAEFPQLGELSGTL